MRQFLAFSFLLFFGWPLPGQNIDFPSQDTVGPGSNHYEFGEVLFQGFCKEAEWLLVVRAD